MEIQQLTHLRNQYRDDLLDHIIPWWQSRFIDHEFGGYLPYRDNDGTLLSTDKPVWGLGRSIWMWSRLYNTVEAKPSWLSVAKHGVDFMQRHAFDVDGRMFFLLTREGRPLRKRRYVFSETFAIIALSEYGRAAKCEQSTQQARSILAMLLDNLRIPGKLPPKTDPRTRPIKGLAVPMILIATAQVLRTNDPAHTAEYNRLIDESVSEILTNFYRPEKSCVIENVLSDGSMYDTPEGRTVNPGHAIETAWFLMEEARTRQNPEWLQKACQILDWSLELGWDQKFGGLLYFVDCDGKPAEPYEHDMKLWWPHTEAIYACLLAWHLTGNQTYAHWHQRIRDWAWSHFPDQEHGEWFGYLHRDGSISSRIKGNIWKGPFHLPRALLLCWQLLDGIVEQKSGPARSTSPSGDKP